MRTACRALPAVLALILWVSAAAASDPMQPPTAELSGSWSAGYWLSCSTGHKGPLQATFCRLDEAHYRVKFSGRFFKVIPFRYTVTLTVTGQEGDKMLLSGSSNLGPLFGTFQYSAEATAQDFVATYCSRNDNGRFVLRRCGCSN